MPITALPPNAIRAIGSSQALTDAASVVKELIDNAIDGKATNISIEVSANTLDDIRVRDNGHGIAPDDRAMICTRYCTSKIRDLQDLESIGGRSLGFRGEALASAAEISGSLTITTRIEGEGTAVEIKFDRKGQIFGEKRASHPMGTTVKIEKFLQSLPVRRQAAEKISAKMLLKIKRMLQAYALARPHLRLSLKILKAKDRKGDWTYPKSGALSASRLEASFNAATDIFGKKLTSQCELKFSSWSSTGEHIEEATSEDLGSNSSRDEAYTLEATMAKPDCDGSVVSNVGQYLSVDSRLVSGTRGTLKQIISSYKSHLRSAMASGDNAKLVDPFLCLNIICPPRSYDANVEPAKDDVLFANSELLLEKIERWFHSVYGEVDQSHSKPSSKAVSGLNPRGIEMLLARKDAPVESASAGLSPTVGSTLSAPRSASKLAIHTQSCSSPLAKSVFDSSAAAPLHHNRDGISGAISHSVTEPPPTDDAQTEAPSGFFPSHDSFIPVSSEPTGFEPSSDAVTVGGEPGWKGSMYTEDEDDDEDLENHLQGRSRSPVDLDPDGVEHVRDVNVSNPWAFAKLNAAMRPAGRKKHFSTPERQISNVGRATASSSDDLPPSVDPQIPEKPTRRGPQVCSSPEAAYPTPSPFPFPQKARGKRKADDASIDAFLTPAPSNKERHKPGALDTWVQKSLGGCYELGDSPDSLQKDQGPLDLPYSRDFVSARSLPPGGTPLGEIPDASTRPRRKPPPRKQQQSNPSNPFISPVNDPNRVWFDTGEDPSRKRPRKPRPNHDHQATALAPTLTHRDDEIEDDESVIPALAERPLRPLHPDLAITLDYEARKQKAGEAHRKALRERATAASKAPANAPNPLHPQHTSTSPHKNRQAKAIAALHASGTPSLGTEEPTALEASDPRAYLLRMHRQAAHAPASSRGKSKRQRTAMLPFETVTEESYVGHLTLVLGDVTVGDVDVAVKEGGAWDGYVKSGAVGGAFEEVGGAEARRWEGELRGLVGGMYAVDGEEGGSAHLDVDLSQIVHARVTGLA